MEQTKQSVQEAGMSVSLNVEERRAIWAVISRSMTRSAEREARMRTGWLDEIYRMIQGMFRQSHVLGTFVAVALLSLSASIAVASSTALPGDSFYPLKIGLENVASRFHWTAQARGAWETQRAVRRLEEAEILATYARLDDVKRDAIRDNFTQHWKEAQKLASDLTTEGDAPAASTIVDGLDSGVRAHEMVLKAVHEALETMEQDGKSLKPLLDDVQEASVSVTQAREEVDDAVRTGKGPGMRNAAQERIITATKSLNETNMILGQGGASYSPEIMDAVEGRSRFAGRMLAHSRKYARRADYESAFETSYLALRALEEGRVLMRMQQNMAENR